MAITLSTGVSVAIAKTFSAAVNMTALTNASEAVATLASGHGVVAGDYLEVASGWDLLDKRIVRAKTVATNSVTFESIDTTDTVRYPAGTGIGTVRIITAWSALSQLKSMSASGGDQNYADITSLVDRTQKQIPTTRSAVSMNIEVFDDPTLPWYSDVTKASDESKPYAVRLAFANGSKLVANAYWSLQKVPSVAANEAMTTQISLSYAADPVRYAA